MQRNQDMFRGSQVVQFLSLSLFIVIFCMWGMCVCLSLSGCGTACVPCHMCGGQRTALWSPFSSLTFTWLWELNQVTSKGLPA